jgi:site-specific recombinase
MIGRLREARAILRRFRDTAGGRAAVDGLLSRARPTDPFEERLRGLAALLAWLSRPGRVDAEAAPPAHAPQAIPPSRAPQATRLLHLLNVLDRNPGWKAGVAKTLRATLREMDALELFCETGLPREPAFWGEALERLLQRLLPADPGRRDLGRLLVSVFPDEESVAWLEQIDEDTLARVAGLASFGREPGEASAFAARRDMPDALVSLASEIASVGLSSAFRRRIGTASFRDLPFYGLTAAAEDVARAAREGDEGALADATARLGRRLAGCRHAMAAVHAHLDQYGVSTRIVYQLERMEAQVRRVELLLGRIDGAGGAPAAAAAFARLVRDAIESTRVGDLVERNARLLARKMVDRSAETGAHYIARNRSEYLAMVRSAAGGGLITVVTAWVKLGLSFLKAPPFVEGVLASVNYAASFVAIQLAHFTLATKQPAMTGPALARRLEHADAPGGVAAFVDEAFHLLRSQAASILGNLATVVPGVVAVDLLARAALGRPLLPIDKAEATLASLSLLGPTPLYAALTGLLLYLSSLAAGWADNWFVLRELEGGLAASPGLGRALGRSRAARLARWLRENVSGFAGNVSLGVLLGMTPALGRFLGLPLDVRHVTLSAGFLAASASALGPRGLLTGPFWWAVGGLASMAVFNVGVSFALALGTAVRARGLRPPERSAVRAAFWTRVWRRPADLVAPDR